MTSVSLSSKDRKNFGTQKYSSDTQSAGAPKYSSDTQSAGAPKYSPDVKGAGARTMKALAAENLRRYWTVAFVAGLGYFLVTVLPVLLNYHHYNQVEDYTRMTLMGHNPMVLTIDVVLAVIISVCVLDYLHRQAACIVVHSMPAKRSHLFNASIISGMLLMLLPLVVVAVMLLFCGGASGTVALHGAKVGHETVRAAEHITLVRCGIWILKNLIVCGYTFVVSCLAGVVAGTRAIHVLTALFFNSLPGIIIGAWFGYAYLFLKGFYVDDGTLMNLWGRTSPVLYCGLSSELIGSTTLGFSGFVLAMVVLGAAAYFVYGRVKLEREGDATVFPLMSDLLCMAVSFVCMSGFASVAAGLSTLGSAELNSQFLLYAIISGTVFFLIFRMVADNSTHIFNLKNLLKFGVFVVLTAVLFAFTVFDVQGFGKKVPAVSDVASVSIHCEEIFNRDAVFTDPAQIETVTKVHKLATESADQADYIDYLISDVVIRYKMSDGSTLVRQYDLRKKEFEVLQTLQGTKPFRDALMLEVTGSGKSLKINGAKADMVYCVFDEKENEYSDEEKLPAKDVPIVAAALNKDLAVLDMSAVMGFETDGEIVELNIQPQDGESAPSYTIDKRWENTVKCMKELGYLK